MTDAKTIADSLTEAQREALGNTTRWSMMLQYRAGILEPLELGLLERDGWGHRLTPLGLAVRKHIQEG